MTAVEAFAQFEATWRPQVEATLEALLPQGQGQVGQVEEGMRYAVLGGGKRLRALAVLAAAAAVGGEPAQALPAAAAVEVLHAYSLVHDDLPAMDNADQRRGQPSVHKAFGEATAILVGDALLTFAFELLGRLPALAGVSEAVSLACVRDLAVAAGSQGLVGGQEADIRAEELEPSESLLQAIHDGKTGALFGACFRLGARIGGGTEEQVEALGRFGQELGHVFQIVDDLLDVVGDPALLGKAVQADAAQQKLTYPRLYGVEAARQMARDRLDQALTLLEGLDAAVLRGLAERVIHRVR
ncbi:MULTISPECIES: polyprenyl synthetase family protein [Limnochorda]|uniref:polyprenyl synthetase family protein n=1 Tax=Limnochorda TaxID=1676651 RepID=UPI0017B11BC5|nr:farnesyl diphosphate synthase [Limnochorda pilosa]MBO2487265.1 geranyl transferase [Bacillota bacterium]MBO2518281.1 geranyl transferase [Bacillota bacterium]NMA71928.1 polyprenyl synthetase family protein [Bacillota bacterium]